MHLKYTQSTVCTYEELSKCQLPLPSHLNGESSLKAGTMSLFLENIKEFDS